MHPVGPGPRRCIRRHFIPGVLEAGASGYLLKDAAFEELSGAIKAILKDQIYLSRPTAGVLVNRFIARAERNRNPSAAASRTVSNRFPSSLPRESRLRK